MCGGELGGSPELDLVVSSFMLVELRQRKGDNGSNVLPLPFFNCYQ